MKGLGFLLMFFAVFSASMSEPSIHLAGTAHGNFDLKANQNIKLWSTSAPFGHVTGGMKYGNGLISVPEDGVYFVYCQLYYNKPNYVGRHFIYVNNKAVAIAGSMQSTEGSRYTGMSVQLRAGDKLGCRLGYNSYVYMHAIHSFFGAFLQSYLQ